MSTQTRRLSFYFLTMEARDDDNKAFNAFSRSRLKEFCDYIDSLDNASRLINIPQANKVVELRSLQLYDKGKKKILKGLVLSGKYNHSPDYLSKKTGSIRATNKQMDEAFAEKTHFLGEVHPNGVELLFENRQAGASLGMVVKCLDKIWNSMPNHVGYFHYSNIAVDNLEEAIKSLQRIRIGNIYFDKTYFTEDRNILGNMEGVGSLQDDVILTLKAKRERTISKASMINNLRTVGAEDSKITRIRLEGRNDEGNTIIDTYLTKKINNVNVSLDKKGLVDDKSIYAKMEEIFDTNE